MKLNWAERLMVNNPIQVFKQKQLVAWFTRTRPMKRGTFVLEIGCGRGAGARIVLNRFVPRRLDAFDLDWQMLQSAGRYLSEAERERITLCAGDTVALPFKSDAYDVIFGFGFLHHVPCWQVAVGEVARVLKPGGAYYFEEYYPGAYQNGITRQILKHPAENRFYSDDLRAGLKASGFQLEHALECKRLGVVGVALKPRR